MASLQRLQLFDLRKAASEGVTAPAHDARLPSFRHTISLQKTSRFLERLLELANTDTHTPKRATYLHGLVLFQHQGVSLERSFALGLFTFRVRRCRSSNSLIRLTSINSSGPLQKSRTLTLLGSLHQSCLFHQVKNLVTASTPSCIHGLH